MKFSAGVLLAALVLPGIHAELAGFTWTKSDADVNAEIEQTQAALELELEEEKVQLERAALYNQWKVEAEAFVESHANAQFTLTKKMNAKFMFYNEFAATDACTEAESMKADERISTVLRGLYGAQDFDFDEMITTSAATYNSTGYRQRDLQNCGACGGSSAYYCRVFPCARRRMEGEEVAPATETLEIEDKSPSGMESVASRLKEDGERQCEGILSLIAYTATDIQHNCRVALKAAKCLFKFDFLDSVVLEVDGVQKTAAEMIAERQSVLARRKD